MRRKIKSFLVCVLAVTLVSCAAGRKEMNPETTAPETLYNHALDLLVEKREYTEAAQTFDQIDRFYPYSRWALKAQIMLAFTHYRKHDYDDAVIVLDRFLQLYPGNQYAPYAYYLKALCFYARLSDVKRDQKMTETALDALNEVIRRFPDTEYAADAEVKINLSFDYLAGKEIEVGRFYLKGNQYIAALNRFTGVVENYQATRYVQEALYRLTETYLILGLVDEAQKSAAVLGYNYPASPWYYRAYALMRRKAPKTIAPK